MIALVIFSFVYPAHTTVQSPSPCHNFFRTVGAILVSCTRFPPRYIVHHLSGTFVGTAPAVQFRSFGYLGIIDASQIQLRKLELSSQDTYQSILALPSSSFGLVQPPLLATAPLALISNASRCTPSRDRCLGSFSRSSLPSLLRRFLPLIRAPLRNLLRLSTHTTIRIHGDQPKNDTSAHPPT